MAGSLKHIVAPDGTFTMDTIENLGDAHEALEECFDLIAFACQLNPHFFGTTSSSSAGSDIAKVIGRLIPCTGDQTPDHFLPA
jgi:hypothetical protein